MAVAQVQIKTLGNPTGAVADVDGIVTLTLDSTPTAGNILVAFAAARDNAITTPITAYTNAAISSGGNDWTLITQQVTTPAGGGHRGGMFWRIAGASEATTVTFTVVDIGTMDMSFQVVEFSHDFTTPILSSASAGFTSETSSSTVASGSTGVSESQPVLWLGFGSVRSGITATMEIDGSATELGVFYGGGLFSGPVGNRWVCEAGWLEAAVTTAQNWTWTSSTSASRWAMVVGVVEEVTATVPQNLVATGIDQDTITLTWDTFVGATGYDIERDSVVIVTNHATTSYTDEPLSPGTEYCYRVRAVFGDGILTGGTVTTSGGYVYHTFTTSGTLTLVGAPVDVEYLVVAGGGGGGDDNGGGGGGGAGGLLSGTTSISASQTVTIGAGGAGGSHTGVNGSGDGSDGTGSSLGAIAVAVAGGGGGGDDSPGATGGSGGGGGAGANTTVGGAGTVGQGNDGGDSASGSGNTALRAGGGGGGAGVAGENAASLIGGDGGDGLQWPAASGTYYAGGGGGSVRFDGSGTVGVGGLGGGGDGVKNGTGESGTANTGGGGGGASLTVDGLGGTGGSGIVIIRYAE